MRNIGLGAAVLLILGGVAYLLYTLLLNAIPAGVPVARGAVTEVYNDPNDQTPREPALPAGPHLDEFQNNCIACHSTRLAMTQPPFTQAAWAKVVHKMVETYGAKIPPVVEGQIVQYLATVKGPK